MKKTAIIISASLMFTILSGCAFTIEESPTETPPLPVVQPELPKENPPEKEPPIEVPETPIEEPEEPIPVEPQLTFVPWSDTVYTTMETSFRMEPNPESEEIESIPLDSKIYTLSMVSNGWAEVIYNGVEGFVLGEHLMKKEEPVEEFTYQSNSIYILDKIVEYENGGIESGQEIIDGNRGRASTWGPVPKWDPLDNMNTYFIGHSDAAFEGIWKTPLGEEIEITGEDALPVTYVLTEIYIVDDYAIGVFDGLNYFDYLVGAGTEEMITLQTCKTEETNYILRAVLKKD